MIKFVSTEDFALEITGECEIQVAETGDSFDGNFNKDEDGIVTIDAPDLDELEGNIVTLILKDGSNSTYTGKVEDGVLVS